MKKFSVLLVILLLATPLLAYGLTTDYDDGGIPLQTIFYTKKASNTVENQVSSFILAEEPGEPGSEEEAPPMMDPFFPEPDGFKGTITEIDAEGKFIKVSNVNYTNHYTGQHEFAESYIFYPNQFTDFVINGLPNQDIHALLIGEQITSIGEPNYEQNKLTDLTVVYQGSVHLEEEVIDAPIEGFIQSIDRENGIFVIKNSSNMEIYTITITTDTEFHLETINANGEKDASLVSTGEIPLSLMVDDFCTAFSLLNQNNEAEALDVLFVDVDNR